MKEHAEIWRRKKDSKGLLNNPSNLGSARPLDDISLRMTNEVIETLSTIQLFRF